MTLLFLMAVFVVGVFLVARATSRSTRMSGGSASPASTANSTHLVWADGGGADGSADCDAGAADCGDGGGGGGNE